MKERPILFSGPMVRAILEGRKTQTRRIVKPRPEFISKPKECAGWYWKSGKINGFDSVESWTDNTSPKWLREFISPYCTYGKPGDRLWVRETFADEAGGTRPWGGDHIYYRADGEGVDLQGGRWSPSIHMPRWASRITLEVTDVRVERLQDISETDAWAEGITLDMLPYNPDDPHPCRTWFRGLWEQINGLGSWQENPWVWVVEFKRLSPEVES